MFLSVLAFTFLAMLALHGNETEVLVLNMANEEILPRHFRTCKDPFIHHGHPSREGLDALPISGSAQYSQLALKAIVKKLNHRGPFIVVDLRQESHGFLNGAAVSWFAPKDWGNLNKTDKEIAEAEKQLLEKLKKEPSVNLVTILEKDDKGAIQNFSSEKVKVQTVQDERQVAQGAHLEYVRFYVPDHMAPSQDVVNAFIAFVRSLPSNAWIHFHCQAGDGRTTTFMALYDMMHNAKKVSFDDIIKRQHLIGGMDLFREGDVEWKQRAFTQRLEFLKKFYHDAKHNQDGFKSGWKSD